MAKLESFLQGNSLVGNTTTFMRRGKEVTRTKVRGKFARGDFERLNIYALIKQLMAKAEDILYRSYYLVEYESELGNLMDSTACAVYVDGELVDDSIIYANEREMSVGPSKNKRQSYAFNSGMKGREAINEWFSNNRYLGFQKNTVQLVIIAAMYYGYFLESGSYGGPQIKVISGIADRAEDEIFGIASKAGYAPSISGVTGYSGII